MNAILILFIKSVTIFKFIIYDQTKNRRIIQIKFLIFGLF